MSDEKDAGQSGPPAVEISDLEALVNQLKSWKGVLGAVFLALPLAGKLWLQMVPPWEPLALVVPLVSLLCGILAFLLFRKRTAVLIRRLAIILFSTGIVTIIIYTFLASSFLLTYKNHTFVIGTTFTEGIQNDIENGIVSTSIPELLLHKQFISEDIWSDAWVFEKLLVTGCFLISATLFTGIVLNALSLVVEARSPDQGCQPLDGSQKRGAPRGSD